MRSSGGDSFESASRPCRHSRSTWAIDQARRTSSPRSSHQGRGAPAATQAALSRLARCAAIRLSIERSIAPAAVTRSVSRSSAGRGEAGLVKPCLTPLWVFVVAPGGRVICVTLYIQYV